MHLPFMKIATLPKGGQNCIHGPVVSVPTNLSKAIRISSTSTHYQVKEVPNGYYEIIFGDGTSTGKAPSAGNKIVIDYLSTKGPEANGASIFSTVFFLLVLFARGRT